jgi:hypothetical protein
MPDKGVCTMLQQKFCRIGVPVPASLKIDQKKRRNFRRKTVFKDQLHPVSLKYKTLYYNNERKVPFTSA